MTYQDQQRYAGPIVFLIGLVIACAGLAIYFFGQWRDAIHLLEVEQPALAEKQAEIEWKLENMTNVCGAVIGSDAFYPDWGNDMSDIDFRNAHTTAEYGEE